MSRTTNAIKNTGFGLLGKLANLILAFLSRTIFIYFLGSTYLGVNGLYSEILSLLSFAELGFGSAMTFAMYKPVADKDTEKIKRLLGFYKTVYRIVAVIITVAGLCLIPFLQYIVKGAEWLNVTELRLYFLIFLANTVVGYFVTYKFAYLNALQKNYINTVIDVPLTLSAAYRSVELALGVDYIGIEEIKELAKEKELNNFIKTVNNLILEDIYTRKSVSVRKVYKDKL